MDGIQPYAGGSRPLVATVHPVGPSPSSVKLPSDYLRAIRRRIWLVLAVAIPIAMGGTMVVLRMQPIYLVTSTIEIKPPRIDSAVAHLINRGEMPRGDASDEKYIPNTLAMLNSRYLAREVVRDPALGLSEAEAEADPAAELMVKIKYRQYPQSNQYIVSLEGKDPDRITKTLNLLLNKFSTRVHTDSLQASMLARDQAINAIKDLSEQLGALERDLTAHIKDSRGLSPGGRNLKEAEYDAVRQRLFFQRERVTNLEQQSQLEMLRPPVAPMVNGAKAQKIASLEEKRKNFQMRLRQARRIAKEASDPAVMHATTGLKEVEADLADLQKDDHPAEGVSSAEVYENLLNVAGQDIRNTEVQLTTTLDEMRDSMPQYHKYISLMGEREQKQKALADLKEKLASFTILSTIQKKPVEIIDDATEPIAPIRPNRTIYIAVCIIFGFSLAVALVCFLEHIDHSVKVPEHLTAGLGLPLFGVVPRMLRNARNHRGGHLWTPGIPDSIEADAYRNLRASLLGITSKEKPIVTLLITSAKAGEGKSTTALNLAATCARAGERTLLMDVDLRRPSLNEVFPRNEEGTGLVDVLRGDLPWQRTVVQTDLPNLDFLPTGDTRDVPIEVLGSLELRQLLISLSEHHYDRVILDGPAVLGLADCRMLGRIVDGAVMVVRSGSQELRPLQRAKSMLEQSQVHIAGLVFNGLNEDLQNWSSYGPNPMMDSSLDFSDARPAGAPRGLDSRNSRSAALMAAGPVEA